MVFLGVVVLVSSSHVGLKASLSEGCLALAMVLYFEWHVAVLGAA